MALLAGFPLIYVHGVSPQAWREIAAAMLPFDDVWGATVGCLLGAWLGAVPIPLDWFVHFLYICNLLSNSDVGIANGKNGLSRSSQAL